MVLYFKSLSGSILAVETKVDLPSGQVDALCWLFSGACLLTENKLDGFFVGPRREMVTPWSTNAVEITQNMGVVGIIRVEEFFPAPDQAVLFDPMLQNLYDGLDEHIFTVSKSPDPIAYVEDIAAYNQKEGLALSGDEIDYLNAVSAAIGRQLTDSEVFGFSQVNSEHCRHKIFNGDFIIDGVEMPSTLFGLIRKTSEAHPHNLVSAYKDNVAFINGPNVEQFAPASQDKPDYFQVKDIESVIALKAETHNFPTTVEPFNGAATGSGGEIRDRMAGGKASFPIAGTAVYMTSYPRLDGCRPWEQKTAARNWLYQSPHEILIKASNGASDFGNKFGQPLICGSVLTFEHAEQGLYYGYDKVIMLAGGIGFAKRHDSLKGSPVKGDKVIVMGGDNYRIGMGGGAVSSVATGEFDNRIELNAVQRSNPEMQKRVANAIRALGELDVNPIVSIHDHGAGGHLNSLSELLEETGGTIEISKLPVGDPTLSGKEIIGNESQERMGMILKEKDIDLLQRISERERAPMYVVGEATGDMVFKFEGNGGGNPIDLKMEYLFGKPPKTVIRDSKINRVYEDCHYDVTHLEDYLNQLLQLEAVACKDWLTNKVDRSVTGKVAMQQTAGEYQLPLNNLGVVSIDYQGKSGIATAIGHAPVLGLIDPARGSVVSVAEALTNIIWAPLKDGLKGVSLSANWMWPCKNQGEDARLYEAVEALSNFAIELGVNVPTGKDSLSMTQKYPNGEVVMAPGTVIVSAGAEVTDVRKTVGTAMVKNLETVILYIDFSKNRFKLGGSSFAQVVNALGRQTPGVKDTAYFRTAFNAVQKLIDLELVLSGHDISAGGMVVTLLEMCFATAQVGLDVNLNVLKEPDIVNVLFSENPGIMLQVKNKDLEKVQQMLSEDNISNVIIARLIEKRELLIRKDSFVKSFYINVLRDVWYKTSFLLDQKQTANNLAKTRYLNYKEQPLQFSFTHSFTGKVGQYHVNQGRRNQTGIKAAIIREKGVNGDREMAYSMHLAGFYVKDVHMTDLVSGRETLDEVNFIVFVGGFSNSDVLGSAKGWAGAFLYNEKARDTLDRFYRRHDTMSLGICNGCQLMVELGLIYPGHLAQPVMQHNDSHKFESAFLTVDIQKSDSIMLDSLAGSRLGVWVAHGEGKFHLSGVEKAYRIAAKYAYSQYPGNPNGSDYAAAAITSVDGRHLAMMPHLERAIFPWQWGYYPENRKADQITPWLEAFVNAREWIKAKKAERLP